MSERVLHITNGDSTAGLLREAGFDDDLLPWRDVLHDGPVPGGLALTALSKARAAFLGRWQPSEVWREQVLAGFVERDRSLARAADYDEVVLWFEHDLYDQLQILQLLDWFAANPPDPVPLRLICIDRHPDVANFCGLGCLQPLHFKPLFAQRVEVSAAQLDLGVQGWQAFRGADPTALDGLRRDDCAALPFLASALTRQLQEYPSRRDGLARTERQILEIVAAGEARPGRIFGQNQDREEAPYMGDWSFWHRIDGLCRGRHALLACSPAPFVFPPLQQPGAAFGHQRLALTALGRAVLAGQADWRARQAPDIWIGGVHLHGAGPDWRWDQEADRIVAI